MREAWAVAVFRNQQYPHAAACDEHGRGFADPAHLRRAEAESGLHQPRPPRRRERPRVSHHRRRDQRVPEQALLGARQGGRALLPAGALPAEPADECFLRGGAGPRAGGPTARVGHARGMARGSRWAAGPTGAPRSARQGLAPKQPPRTARLSFTLHSCMSPSSRSFLAVLAARSASIAASRSSSAWQTPSNARRRGRRPAAKGAFAAAPGRAAVHCPTGPRSRLCAAQNRRPTARLAEAETPSPAAPPASPAARP
jgi:hypothetical protein